MAVDTQELLKNLSKDWDLQSLKNFTGQAASATSYDVSRAHLLIKQLSQIKRDPIRLFEPMPLQKSMIESTAREILAIGGNRAGKSTACAFRFASMVRGMSVLTGASPGVPREGGRACVIGKDLDHIGRVIYPLLFKPGLFKIIRDRLTGEWRSFRRNDPEDAKRAKEAVLAPPLIPKRLIADGGIAWLQRRRNIPKLIRLTNGWEIVFFSSEGDPPKGDAYQLAWIDEELYREEFYSEISARLATGGGYFMWSATAQDGGDPMIQLHEDYLVNAADPNSRIREYIFLPDDNVHFDPVERELLKAKYASRPEEYRVRILGEFLQHGFRVYSEFDMSVHGFDLKQLKNGEIPPDWARWCVVDPGRQVCAVLFAAMPPTGDRIVLYDELYIQHCTAQKFAEAVERKTKGASFESFLIDMHAGKIHDMNAGNQVEAQYHVALRDLGVWERFRTKQFVWGCDDIMAGIEAVHNKMIVDRRSGHPQLQVARDRMPNFEREIKFYIYKREGNVITDKPRAKNSHLMDTMRYLVLFNPEYRTPVKPKPPRSWAGLRMEQKRKQNGQNGFVNLGPTSRVLAGEN